MGEQINQSPNGGNTKEELELAKEMMTSRDEELSDARAKNITIMQNLATKLRESGLNGFEDDSANGNHLVGKYIKTEGREGNRELTILEGFVGGEPIKLVFEDNHDNQEQKYTATIGGVYLYDNDKIEKLFNKLNPVAITNDVSYRESAKELKKKRANLMLEAMVGSLESN